MKGLPEERAVECAKHIISTGDTVRQAAKKFNISKSTVHTEVTKQNGWWLGLVRWEKGRSYKGLWG